MASTAIPHTDQALLEAQAQAGQAGVLAYEAAKRELEQGQQRSIDEVQRQAQLRGGPAGAMESALGDTNALYQRRQDSLTQAQAGAARQAADRESRMANYNQGVLGARSLIADQAKMQADPIRLRGEANVASIARQADADILRMQTEGELNAAEFERQMRAAAEEAAREQQRYENQLSLEEQRWQQEMAQRERLAAADRAASSAAAAKALTTTEGEMSALLQSAGLSQLGNVRNELALTLEAAKQATGGDVKEAMYTINRQDRESMMEVYDQYFKRPSVKSPKYEQEYKTWLDRRSRWLNGDIRDEDLRDVQTPPMAGTAYRWEPPTRDTLESLRQSYALMNQARERISGLNQLADIGFEVPTDRFSRATVNRAGAEQALNYLPIMAAQLKANPEALMRLSPYLQTLQAGGVPGIDTPDELSVAMGLQDFDPYVVDASQSQEQMALGLADWQSRAPRADTLQQLYGMALDEADPTMGGLYSVHPAEVLNARLGAQGLTALDVLRGNPQVGGYAGWLKGIEDQAITDIEGVEKGWWEDWEQDQKLKGAEREDIRFGNYLTEQTEQANDRAQRMLEEQTTAGREEDELAARQQALQVVGPEVKPEMGGQTSWVGFNDWMNSALTKQMVNPNTTSKIASTVARELDRLRTSLGPVAGTQEAARKLAEIGYSPASQYATARSIYNILMAEGFLPGRPSLMNQATSTDPYAYPFAPPS